MSEAIHPSFVETLKHSVESHNALPGYYYTDETLFEDERNSVFHGDWVFACPEVLVSEAHQYYAFDLCGEPVVLIRGKDGELRAFSNVCRHRSTPILDEGYGQAERLICPYHAWTYNQEGRLTALPHAGDADIDKSGICLPQFHVAVWQGLVFVSLAAQSDLATHLSEVDEYLKAYEPERYRYAHIGENEHWQSNWKLIYENAAESYHLFKVHKETLETITPTKSANYVAGGPRWTLTEGEMKTTPGWLDWLSGSEVPKDHYYLIALPPGFVAIITYDALAWISIRPINAFESRVESGALAADEGREDAESVAFTQQFFAEDKAICERVQRGVNSAYAEGGALVSLEQVLVDFYAYLAARITI
ncbi:MAG: aromatic ring-hydroxylating dioxygenase subunit alpha [Xanthomonadales bacterium]|nr:aromatic ring-hydroxylating dioxygenase subunit alpha [Xanthomonadales bacterium]